jgi:RNA polymerase sigma-70 factor (ECF subfamily)
MDAYARHGRALLRKAERLLGNRDDAQDVVQALFVDLLSRGENPDLPYLYRAITNRCLTILRDEKNRARLLEQNDDSLRPPARTRCDDRAIGLNLLLRLAKAVDERALEIISYRFFDDMTLEEIAALTTLSRKTVAKILDDVTATITLLSTQGGAPNSLKGTAP